MALAELRLRPGPDEHDQEFGLLCCFCRGEQENGCIGFDREPNDAESALEMMIEHYMKWHPSLLKEAE